MMRTDELRKVVKTQLDSLKTQGIKEVYYATAADNAGFPHIVYNLTEIGSMPNDLHRYNYVLEVDVWDKGKSESKALTICDKIEELLSASNLPQTLILPTFFFESRRNVIDEDKNLKHELIRFEVQLYVK